MLKNEIITQVLETDLAQPINTSGAQFIVLNQVNELDTAFTINTGKNILIGQSQESNIALAITSQKIIELSQTIEVDIAQSISVDKNVIVGQVSELDVAFTIFTGIISGTAVNIHAGVQKIILRTATNVPLEITVDQGGGISGLLVTVMIRDSDNSSSYLDFADNTFKTSGWTQRERALSDLTGGFYHTTINVAAITNLPAGGNLVASYNISGAVAGITSEILHISENYLTTGQFLALK